MMVRRNAQFRDILWETGKINFEKPGKFLLSGLCLRFTFPAQQGNEMQLSDCYRASDEAVVVGAVGELIAS